MILLGLGSNVGDRVQFLARARWGLAAQKIVVKTVSSVIETPALLPDDAPEQWNIPFLNQVIEVITEKSPEELLVAVKSIEQSLGRQDRGRWGPREIDIDLLDYDGKILDTDMLVLPHPGMAQRRFVLAPIAEIAPLWQHPTLQKTAAELLEALDE